LRVAIGGGRVPVESLATELDVDVMNRQSAIR
jgi:hypothetical protein